MEIAERVLPEKKSSKGLTPGQMVESFILLSALGGDCVDDMERLRQDKGLAAMLGYTPPASETARQWLDKFHEEDLPAAGRADGEEATAGVILSPRIKSSGRIKGNKPSPDMGLCRGGTAGVACLPCLQQAGARQGGDL